MYWGAVCAGAASWQRVWEQVIPFFAYPLEIRKIAYTTNAIESLHMQLRKMLETPCADFEQVGQKIDRPLRPFSAEDCQDMLSCRKIDNRIGFALHRGGVLNTFISKRDRRERKAHGFPKARKKVRTPTK